MTYRERTGEEISRVAEPDMGRSYTAGEYLQWTFEGFYELIRGKVFKMSPAPGRRHQKISMKLIQLFSGIWNSKQCEFYHAPFDVYFTKPGQHWKDSTTVTEPDLCIICDPSKIQEPGCIGSPDFILEILSKGTANKDRREKFQIYEEYGVPEYWIVDPFTHSVTRNILKTGKYEIQRTNVSGESIAPRQFPELVIKISEIFEGLEM